VLTVLLDRKDLKEFKEFKVLMELLVHKVQSD
jgi:hypothetical protein